MKFLFIIPMIFIVLALSFCGQKNNRANTPAVTDKQSSVVGYDKSYSSNKVNLIKSNEGKKKKKKERKKKTK